MPLPLRLLSFPPCMEWRAMSPQDYLPVAPPKLHKRRIPDTLGFPQLQPATTKLFFGLNISISERLAEQQGLALLLFHMCIR